MSEPIEVKEDRTLLERLSTVQKELKAPKSQKNDFGNYNYRSCEDILEAAKPLLEANELVLVVTDHLIQVGERYYVEARAEVFHFSDSKYSIFATAFAREAEEKKGMDVAQVTGSASSYARKYALNGLFCIDDTKDPDGQDNRTEGSKTPPSAPPTPSKKPATEKQINTIKGLLIQLGVTKETRDEMLAGGMTIEAASESIKALTAKIKGTSNDG